MIGRGNWVVRPLLALGLASVVLGVGLNASAQSTADGKRTLKAEKIFYQEPGMIEVEIRAMRDTLMMTGYVPSDAHIKKADELAGKVKGVRDIRNRIRVREAEVASGGDAGIQAKIEKAIEEDEDLAKAKAKKELEISVKDGNVVASGKVSDWAVAQQLVNDVKRVPGVKTFDIEKLRY